MKLGLLLKKLAVFTLLIAININSAYAYMLSDEQLDMIKIEKSIEETVEIDSLPLIDLIASDSIEVQKSIAKEKEDIAIIRKKLEEKISFPFDERFFTLYAFMNYTGYDAKNLDSYYPVRQELRNELERKDIDIKEAHYYKNRTVDIIDNGKLIKEPILYSNYVDFIRRAGLKFPGFSMSNIDLLREEPYTEISDLAVQLYNFYNKANLKAMIPKYRNYHSQYISTIDENVYDGLSYIIYIYNMGDIKDVNVDINLLEASARRVSFIEDDIYTKKPSMHIGVYSNAEELSDRIIHEYLHLYVDEALDKHEIDLINMNGKVRYPVDGIYNDKKSVMSESIVRVLANIYKEKLYTKAFKEDVTLSEKEGFVFSSETYEKLISFDFSSGSLSDFLDELLISYTRDDRGVLSGDKNLKEHPINKLRFIYDEKVFSLFLLLNATGYDDISNDKMAHIRESIRSNIEKKDIIGFEDYYKNNGISVDEYVKLLSDIGPAPDFHVNKGLNNEVTKLARILKTFHKRASIDDLYEFYKEEQEKVSYDYVNKSTLKTDLLIHNDYYNIAYDDMKIVDVNVNLLGAYGNSYLTSRNGGPYIIVEDSKLIGTSKNAKEFYISYIESTISLFVKSIITNNQVDKDIDIKIEKNTLAYDRCHGKSEQYIVDNLVYAIHADVKYSKFPSSLIFNLKKKNEEGFELVEAMYERVVTLKASMSYDDMIKIIIDEAYSGTYN